FVRLVKACDQDSMSHINETDKILTQSIDEIRKLSHALIPPTFHENELMQAIENIIRITTMAGKIRVVKRIASFDESKLCDQLRLTIYRIIQEQFNNIAKHAGANCITLTLQQEQDQVILSIADNGKGFDTTQKTSGVGLLNVKTRASLYNGQVAIHSSPGNGCEVVVCFDASGASAKHGK
ncbi:MAG TPA: ATP-binding protein, partial [Chitinophagaceae bacterium]|nr:ATP-binding protein [Chitinophagaceae bacterium]